MLSLSAADPKLSQGSEQMEKQPFTITNTQSQDLQDIIVLNAASQRHSVQRESLSHTPASVQVHKSQPDPQQEDAIVTLHIDSAAHQ